MLHNNKIQIAILEVSEVNRAVLEFYFDSVGEDFYDLVDKEQAEAFISDYDYEGAKADIEQAIDTFGKPIAIISTEEQNLASTIYLKQPLSAAALTVASEKITQMISVIAKQVDERKEDILVNESEESHDSAVMVVTEDSLLNDIGQRENESTEVVSKDLMLEASTPKEPVEAISQIEDQAEAFASNDDAEEMDFFEVLDESNDTNTEDENHQKILGATLGITSRNSVGSDKINNKEDSILELLDYGESFTDQASSAGEEAISLEEISSSVKQIETDYNEKIEFADVVIDVKSVDEGDSKESENEVDALLESLIRDSEGLSEDSEVAKIDEADSHDVFLENLDSDEEQEEIEDKIEVSLEEDISDKEVIIEADIAEEKEIADLTNFVDEELVLKFDNDNETEIDHVQKNRDIVIDESFTIHDDQNPSQENIFTETLQVDSIDLETKNNFSNMGLIDEDALLETEELFDLAIDEIDDTAKKEAIQNSDASGEFDKELLDFEFELENEFSENFDKTETIPSLTVVEPDHKAEQNHNSDDKISEIELTQDVDLDAEIDLDSLLKEVAIDEATDDAPDNNVEKIAENSKTELLETPETSAIEDDFVNPTVNNLETDDSPDIELQTLLNEIRQEAGKNDPHAEFGANGQFSSAVEHNEAESDKRWVTLCGEISSISQQKEVDKISYTYNKHLLNAVLEQLESTKGSDNLYRMKYKDLIIVIDHSKNRIYCNIPAKSDDYAAVCFSEIDPQQIKIHDLDYSEVRLYRKKMKENMDRSHSLESFIWTTSLLTSQGRLPKGTDIKQAVTLRDWPDLTRLELIPHAINIAAVLSKQAKSLLEISESLDIPQRYVFAFYNASLALNMIELGSNNKSPSLFSKKAANKKSEEKGVFSRLFKRSK